MTETAKKRRIFSMLSLITGLLCLGLAVFPLSVHLRLRGGGTGQGLGDAVLYFTLVGGLIALMVVSGSGVILNIVATWRRETGKSLLVSRILNLGILTTTVFIYISAFWIPQKRARAETARERQHYLESRSREELLIEAIWENRLEKARELIDRGADPNGTDRFGQSVLSFAIAQGSGATVEFLLRHGAVANPAEPTELHTAARLLKPDIVKVLVEHGWNPDLKLDYRKDGNLVSPLDCARSRDAAGTSDKENKEAVIDYLVRVSQSGDTTSKNQEPEEPGTRHP